MLSLRGYWPSSLDLIFINPILYSVIHLWHCDSFMESVTATHLSPRGHFVVLMLFSFDKWSYLVSFFLLFVIRALFLHAFVAPSCADITSLATAMHLLLLSLMLRVVPVRPPLGIPRVQFSVAKQGAHHSGCSSSLQVPVGRSKWYSSHSFSRAGGGLLCLPCYTLFLYSL